MITHLRNRALTQLGISFALLLLSICIAFMGAFGFPRILSAIVAIPMGTFALVYYVKGNITLAEAKGHTSSSVGAIIIVAALCTSFLFFAMPLIILFGFEDKAKRRRSHRSEPETTRFNPIAELPPRREDQ